MVRDPELIKRITIKDFDHFINHRPIFADIDDEKTFFGSSLFAMENERWKDMRSTLSPVFTGRKMREMFRMMNKVAQESVEFIGDKIRKQEDLKGLEMEMKEFVTRYTNDVIASTAFGLEVNSFVDQNNEFYTMGKRLTKSSFWQNIKFFLFLSYKRLMKVTLISINPCYSLFNKTNLVFNLDSRNHSVR